MSSTTPYDAIKARLVDQLGGTYPVRDWEEIETVLQQGTDPFLALDDSAGQASLESIGTPQQNWNRDTGFVVVHIFVPSTGSLAAARNIGDMIRHTMRFFRFTVPEGETLRCLNVDPPGPGPLHDGLWHAMMVSVDYEHRYAVPTAA